MSDSPVIDRPRSLLIPHLVWEGILAGLVVIVSVLAVSLPSVSVFSHGTLFLRYAYVLPVAVGLALSMRTGAANLAVGGIATMSGVLYADLIAEGSSALVAGLAAVAIALGFGLVLALVTALSRVPGWAVTLAGLAVTEAIAIGVPNGQTIAIRTGGLGTGALDAIAVVFVIVSLAGGVLWLTPPVRATLGPAPSGRVTLPGALAGIVGSSVLAALAGVFQAGYIHSASPVDSTPLLLTAVAAVLLGGVSASGRGGGVAGTVLGSFLLTVIYFWALIDNEPSWVGSLVPPAVAIVVGACVSRFVNQD